MSECLMRSDRHASTPGSSDQTQGLHSASADVQCTPKSLSKPTAHSAVTRSSHFLLVLYSTRKENPFLVKYSTSSTRLQYDETKDENLESKRPPPFSETREVSSRVYCSTRQCSVYLVLVRSLCNCATVPCALCAGILLNPAPRALWRQMSLRLWRRLPTPVCLFVCVLRLSPGASPLLSGAVCLPEHGSRGPSGALQAEAIKLRPRSSSSRDFLLAAARYSTLSAATL